MPASRFSRLKLSRLRVPVRLGWTADERAVEQWVALDIELRLASVPDSCISDELAGTVDYGALGLQARGVCMRREFRLIERMAGDVYKELRERLPVGTLLRICVTKEKPPLPDLEGGATFALGDWDAELS